MERRVIKENSGNNLKYMDGITPCQTSAQIAPFEHLTLKDVPMTEDVSNKENKLEYFTE